jgi:hypothetical protein
MAVSGRKSMKFQVKQGVANKTKKPQVLIIVSPCEQAIDTNSLVVLDAKVNNTLPFKELFNRERIKVIGIDPPKNAIQKYGEIARCGAIVAQTINK